MRGMDVVRGVVMAASLLLIATGASGQGMLSIEGTATYRERMALPPDAVFEATLEDVSRVDATASVLGQTQIEQPGNPPFHFSIQYDPTQIQPNHIYVVRASIAVNGRPLFTTDQRYQVLTQGHGSEIGMMMLHHVSGAASPAAAPLSLRGTYWKLVQIGDRQITPADQQQEAYLIFRIEDEHLTGSGGCNRLAGSYTASNDALRVSGIASTRMACLHGMETESNFLTALEGVRSWKISNRQLELSNEDGKMLLRFTAQTMKSK
ncbi:putative lipoprotein [Edaphobacter modestus]|uniref:Putative lipoprotein n=2 Tax=Edaphobacter modestus TaxID=388466 RepID=A0A4Q7YT10_9BACT|nr:putative lipoprotein [Edaphobacter modestus]